jgi:hypothetical protein
MKRSYFLLALLVPLISASCSDGATLAGPSEQSPRIARTSSIARDEGENPNDGIQPGDPCDPNYPMPPHQICVADGLNFVSFGN